MIHARHRGAARREDAAHIDFMARRYGYDQLALIDPTPWRDELGTDVYHGGLIDHGGGHLHPLNLALGMARAAMAAQGRDPRADPRHGLAARGRVDRGRDPRKAG
jgi:gamma-glutamylputrescine oxidase